MAHNHNECNPECQDGLSTAVHAAAFEIRVRGHLDDSWSDWLGGLRIELLDNGEMILSGPIRDQAALMGILNKLYSLNLALLSVQKVESIKKQGVVKNGYE